jgi:alpha-beta hydrolase superfamily lysophospholipase
VAFEHEHERQGEEYPENLVIAVGGLGDGLLTVSLFNTLAVSLPPSWSLAQAILTSSYGGWGNSSVSQDAEELAACVSYFRTIKRGKIVIMGHSTGSQDVMDYLTGRRHSFHPTVDGAILQAPISDREAMLSILKVEDYQKTISEAQQMVDDDKEDDMLPSSNAANVFGSPVSARRWLSLASPAHDSEEDFFSSDLKDEQLLQTFGRLPAHTSVCILYSGADEFVPPMVDKKALVEKWISIAKSGGACIDAQSGIVEGASHNLTEDPELVVNGFIIRVLGFLRGLSPLTTGDIPSNE